MTRQAGIQRAPGKRATPHTSPAHADAEQQPCAPSSPATRDSYVPVPPSLPSTSVPWTWMARGRDEGQGIGSLFCRVFTSLEVNFPSTPKHTLHGSLPSPHFLKRGSEFAAGRRTPHWTQRPRGTRRRQGLGLRSEPALVLTDHLPRKGLRTATRPCRLRRRTTPGQRSLLTSKPRKLVMGSAADKWSRKSGAATMSLPKSAFLNCLCFQI